MKIKVHESYRVGSYDFIEDGDTVKYALRFDYRTRQDDAMFIYPCMVIDGKPVELVVRQSSTASWNSPGKLWRTSDFLKKAIVVDTHQEVLQEFLKHKTPNSTSIAMQHENCVYWCEVSDNGKIRQKDTRPFAHGYNYIDVPENGEVIDDGIDGSMGGRNWDATVYWREKDAVNAALRWVDNAVKNARKVAAGEISKDKAKKASGASLKARIAQFQDSED